MEETHPVNGDFCTVHPIIHSLTYRYLVLFFSQCAGGSSRKVDCLKCSSIYYQPHLSFVVTYIYFHEVVHTWVKNVALCCYAYKCKKSNIFIPLSVYNNENPSRTYCRVRLLSTFNVILLLPTGGINFMFGYFDSISSSVINFHLCCCCRYYLRSFSFPLVQCNSMNEMCGHHSQQKKYICSVCGKLSQCIIPANVPIKSVQVAPGGVNSYLPLFFHEQLSLYHGG